MKGSSPTKPTSLAPFQFRQLAEEMPLAVIELDANLNIVHVNSSALDLLGLKLSDIEAGVHADQLVVPEQVRMVHEGLKQLAAGAKPTSMSLRLLRRDGVQVLTEVFAQPLKSGSRVTGFLAYIFDLSRRAAKEEKIGEEMDLLRAFVEHASVGICVIDDKYQIEYANDALCDITGTSRSEILGHDFREFLHPDSIALTAERYRRRQAGEQVPAEYDIKVPHKDGTLRIVEFTSRTITSRRGQTKTVAQAVDATEERDRESRLQTSEHRYRTLVETMDSGLAVDDDKSSIVLVNAALCRMLGYDSSEDLVGRPITDMIYGWSKEDVEEKMKARRAGRVEHYDVDLIRKSGALVPAMVAASPLFDPVGKYFGSFAIFTDVSELKSAEEEARFLLDLLLHDVGNQLQLILAGADLLDNGSVTPEVENARRYVTEGANRCIELINKVRRAEEAKAEPLVTVDLMDVLDAEIHLLSRQYRVEPEVGLLPEHLYILADSSLNHLLWNLMENAVKHNSSPDKHLWINGEFSGSTFELRIADNGPGLSDSKKRQFFDPRRRYGGVGLHLVHRLADKYGAWVEAKDRVAGSPEQGLEVRVRFLVMSQ
ncbi:MAG: hypothetical protein C4K47_02780 [Candidatus Thorarchaeota archaeon]|nr:MAG: hypothetical protein C4K47_02780 [Candidatus Thorarchaeota archaeon]